MIGYRRTRTRQPVTAVGIASGHWAAPRVSGEGVWMPGVALRSFSSGNATSGIAPGRTIGPFGIAGSFDGVNQYQTVAETAGDLPAALTMFAILRGASAPGSVVSAQPLWANRYAIGWDHGDPAFRAAAAVYVSGTYYSAGFGTLSGATWYTLAATWDGSNLRAYTNGSLMTTTAAAGAVSSTADSMTLGKSGSNPWPGDILLAVKLNRALTPLQIASLTANPWQLFAPAPRRLWLGPSASGRTSTLLLLGAG